MRTKQRIGLLVLLCVCGGLIRSLPACAQTAPAAQESMSDAWWTGPMLANSAETLPPGHFLFEPYLYDIHSSTSDSFGSRSYILYGLANRLSVGIIPVFGYNRMRSGPSSNGVGVGDITLQAQYRLTEFQPGQWMPTTAILLEETLPTGKYDQLGNRPSDGLGAGAYTTTLALNSQRYFWLPNGRLLRMRFNLSEALSRNANVRGVSVYGTGPAFRGNVKPGNGFFADLAFEYSLTQRWVLALDATYSHNDNTRVVGEDPLDPGNLPYVQNVRINSGSSVAFGLAPAIEYNWSSAIGVLLGTRVTFGGHNAVNTVTPAIAINYVY
ncbi:transporter [Dyella acidiphila]|uniref:Transporter n=1 Tax=Dyella acidiphila TaxID=2775866 RepID=A0ABR9GFA9_9GAMM|nr:transporter [Dyella acidiphila]MBE1162719.1 transporter [Dyella acidiphila]